MRTISNMIITAEIFQEVNVSDTKNSSVLLCVYLDRLLDKLCVGRVEGVRVEGGRCRLCI